MPDRKEGWRQEKSSMGVEYILEDLRTPPSGWIDRHFRVYKTPADWGEHGGKWYVDHQDGDMWSETLGRYKTKAQAQARAQKERSSSRWRTRRGPYRVTPVPYRGKGAKKHVLTGAALKKVAKFKWRSIRQGRVIDSYKPWPPAPSYVVYRRNGKWQLSLNRVPIGLYDTPAAAKKVAETHAATGTTQGGSGSKRTTKKSLSQSEQNRRLAAALRGAT